MSYDIEKAKAPIPFVREVGSRGPEFWACGACGAVHASDEMARECCAPRVCELCGGEVERRYRTMCCPCSARERERRDRERWEKATKVLASEYEGAVYDEDHDRWHSDVGEWEEWCDAEGVAPGRAYACINVHPSLDVESLLEGVLDQAPEEFGELDIEDVENLRAFVAAWNARQDRCWWETDHRRAIVLGDRS